MNEKETYNKMSNINKVKLSRLGIKLYLNLCQECRKTVLDKHLCSECIEKNKNTLDKMHKITGERYG